MTSAEPFTPTFDGPITKSAIGQRLELSATGTITFDGVRIGAINTVQTNDFVMGSPRTKTVWIAKIPNLCGHRIHKEAHALCALREPVLIAATKILRDAHPDSDWGALWVRLGPEEFHRIQRGEQTELHLPFGQRYSKKSCFPGRALVLASGEGRCQSTLDATVASFTKLDRGQAAIPALRIRFPNNKSFGALAFTVSAAANAEEGATAPVVAEEPPAAPAYRETQASILEWERKTFGVPSGLHRALTRLATRALEEAVEVVRAVTCDALVDEIMGEVADVAVMLCALAGRVGIDDVLAVPPAEFDRKATAVTMAAAVARKLAHLVEWPDLHALDIQRLAVNETMGVLMALAARCRRDLRAAVDAKMAVNRSRRFDLDATGCGYRREEAAEPPPPLAQVEEVLLRDSVLTVRLKNGSWITLPRSRVPQLASAKPEQAKNWQASAAGIHWPDIGADLPLLALVSATDHANVQGA